MWQIELTEKFKASFSAQERKAVIAEFQGLTGCSKQHLYRIARSNGFKTGREKRKDRGCFKSGLKDNQIELIASLLHTTGRENKGPIMPVERAIQIAEDNGIIEREQVTPHTLNRILRERQISKTHQKAETPHTEMRSLHPNHVHAFDVSVCIQYYLKNGRLGIIDERDFYKNKPDNFKKIKERLLRYVIVDHFSGAFYFRYYNTTGETQDNLFGFLKEAWQKKDWTPAFANRLPFRGVPFLLLWDAGAANKSGSIKNFIEHLDIDIPRGMPYNPRRQGSVETTHKILEEWFEVGLRIQPATSVDEMNLWAADFMTWYQATQNHTRHGMTRTQCWMLIQKEQLRELPSEDILHDLYMKPEEERTVDGTYIISYRGKEYRLKHIEGLFRGAKVKVLLKPFKFPVVDILYKEKIYEANPVEVLPAHLGAFRADAAIIGQEYKSQPETLTQQAIKRMENMAYGEKSQDSKFKIQNAVPFEGLIVHGIHADKVGNISFIEKKGTAIEVDRSITEKQISFTEFLKRLIAEAGTITKELNQQLRELYGESISIADAEEMLRQAQHDGIEGVMRQITDCSSQTAGEKEKAAM